jgi:hypothetical protein
MYETLGRGNVVWCRPELLEIRSIPRLRELIAMRIKDAASMGDYGQANWLPLVG